MTYHHVIRVQDLDGAVNYHRHESGCVEPLAWENTTITDISKLVPTLHIA